MTVIDKRGKELDTCFGDLNVGDVFQGTDDHIYLKTSCETALMYKEGYEYSGWVERDYDYAELIIPLKATLTIERGE
jgi:hypothetical protein